MQRALRAHDVAQRAVNSEAHQRISFKRFDVNVRCAVARGLRQQGVDHADDRRVVFGLQEILDVRDLLHHSRDIEFTFDVTNDLLRRAALIAIGLRNCRDQLARLDDDRLDLAREDADDLVQCGQRRGVADPDLGIALALRHEQDGVVARERVGDEAVGGDHKPLKLLRGLILPLRCSPYLVRVRSSRQPQAARYVIEMLAIRE